MGEGPKTLRKSEDNNFSKKNDSRDIFKNVNQVQVILFEIDCTIFHTNLRELFCPFIS